MRVDGNQQDVFEAVVGSGDPHSIADDWRDYVSIKETFKPERSNFGVEPRLDNIGWLTPEVDIERRVRMMMEA